jgi:P-type Cu+ transporter
MEKEEWLVEGMTCNTCANTVKKALEQKGLKDVQVSFANHEASFINQDQLSVSDIQLAIKDFGYSAKPAQDVDALEEHNHASNHTSFLFWLSLPFSLILFSHMLFHDSFLNLPLVQFFLCLPVFAIGVYYFGRSAFQSIKVLSPNMDVLISIGFSSAFFYSTYGLYHGLGENFLFFETASTIITLVLLGNVIEKKAVAETSNSVKELLKMQGTTALVMRNGTWEEIKTSEIQEQDLIKLKNGNQIPVDGILTEGELWVNEAMISGESLPLLKSKGDKLIGATTIEDGLGTMQALKVGKATVVSQIVKILKSAQQNQPSIQRVGDQVSAIFVPVVIGLAALTFILNYFFNQGFEQSMLNAIAVLVISCPCAMGLATPTAVMVGLGKATKKGILIKSGETIERIKKVDTVVFDKTGTLTDASFSIESITYHTQDKAMALNVLYTLEKHSTHPIALAIVQELDNKAQAVELPTLSEIKGKGMLGIDKAGDLWELKAGNGDGMLIELTKNQELVLTLKIQDTIKAGAKEMVAFLQSKGIEVILLSGDKQSKCTQVANQLGIIHVFAEHNPQQKYAFIEAKVKNNVVAMVGDGINDAPALTLAHVGISFNEASQIAVSSSAVVILGHRLEAIPQLFTISYKTYRTIVQNLYWAFMYNIVAIPMAAMGMVNPMLGALTMAFSDVVVIGNSILLKLRSSE